MPAARSEALRNLAGALAGGGVVLDPGSDREEAQRKLLSLRGMGPWTASYVAMRALGDPDAFLPTDLGVRRAVSGLGYAGAPRAWPISPSGGGPGAPTRRSTCGPAWATCRDTDHEERGGSVRVYVDEIGSPAGPLAFAVDEEGALIRLHFVESDCGAVMEEELEDEGYVVETDEARTARVREELSEYASGRRKTFDAPLAFAGSEWQRAVWMELTRIPFGETRSYGEIAYNLGRPGAARAVGGQTPPTSYPWSCPVTA